MIKSIVFISFLLISTSSFSQFPSAKNIRDRIINRAADRTVEKTNQKVDESVDKSVDKIFDSLFGGNNNQNKSETESNTNSSSNGENTNNSQEDAMKMLNGILGGMGSAPAPTSTYSFSSSYVMKIHSTTRDGSSDMNMKYYFTKKGNYVGTKFLGSSDPQIKSATNAMEAMIMDFDNNSMYTFMNSDGKKSMMGISLNSTTTDMANETINKNVENSSFTKTSETKTIAGYTCDGYILKQGDDESKIWISRSRVPVVSTYYESFQKMSSSGKSNIRINYAANSEMIKFASEGRGMLEMESKDKNGSEMTMQVVDINKNDSFSFATSGYENMMDFNKIRQYAQKQQNATN